MKYFIGYLIEGTAAEYHRHIMREISEKFGTRMRRTPSHVTLFRPFETDDISPVVSILREWASNPHGQGHVTLFCFGRFRDAVVYIQVAADEIAFRAIKDLFERMESIPEISTYNRAAQHLHLTLASRLSEEKIEPIWRHLSSLAAPKFIIPFDNIALFKFTKEGKWIIEKEFLYK